MLATVAPAGLEVSTKEVGEGVGVIVMGLLLQPPQGVASPRPGPGRWAADVAAARDYTSGPHSPVWLFVCLDGWTAQDCPTPRPPPPCPPLGPPLLTASLKEFSFPPSTRPPCPHPCCKPAGVFVPGRRAALGQPAERPRGAARLPAAPLHRHAAQRAAGAAGGGEWWGGMGRGGEGRGGECGKSCWGLRAGWAGQGRASCPGEGQGRAGQGRAGQGRAGQAPWMKNGPKLRAGRRVPGQRMCPFVILNVCCPF